MNTLVKNNLKPQQVYVPTTALAKRVNFDEDLMHVALTDGRIVSVPLIWFPLLHQATPEQRQQYEIGAGGVSLHWSEFDEDISIAHLMAGVDWQWA